MPYTDFIDFQGGFKKKIEPAELEKLKNSIAKHGIFVPKYVWFDGDKPMILDGHQTMQGLASLEIDGYTIPDIPYVEIQAADAKDAAEKLMQINSRYAVIDPDGVESWAQSLEFDPIELEDLIGAVEIPELDDIIDFEIFDDTSTDRDGQGVNSTWDNVKSTKNEHVYIGEICIKITKKSFDQLNKKLEEHLAVGVPYQKTIEDMIWSLK